MVADSLLYQTFHDDDIIASKFARFSNIEDSVDDCFTNNDTRDNVKRPISISEIEEIILQYPAVYKTERIRVYDPVSGDRLPAAVVTLKESVSEIPEEITEFVDQRVVSYRKISERIYIVVLLPHQKKSKLSTSEDDLPPPPAA